MNDMTLSQTVNWVHNNCVLMNTEELESIWETFAYGDDYTIEIRSDSEEEGGEIEIYFNLVDPNGNDEHFATRTQDEFIIHDDKLYDDFLES